MWWVETIRWPEAVLWTIRRWGMLCESLSAGELEKLEMYTPVCTRSTRPHTLKLKRFTCTNKSKRFNPLLN